MEKAFVVQKVATKLIATENAVDAAMTEAAELMAGLMQARQDVKLSACVGDDVAAKLVEAMTAISAARSAMVAVHNELNDVRLRMRVPLKMTGVEKLFEATAARPADLREVG